MRTCIGCQGQFKEEELDSKYERCDVCMGYKTAEDNLNTILPILNNFGTDYKKESWGNGEGISLYLEKGIFINFANAGGVSFEYDEDTKLGLDVICTTNDQEDKK